MIMRLTVRVVLVAVVGALAPVFNPCGLCESAQVAPPQQQLIHHRLSAARMAAMKEHIRRYATALTAAETVKQAGIAKEVQKLRDATAEIKGKSGKTPSQSSAQNPRAKKSGAATPHQPGKAISTATRVATKSGSKKQLSRSPGPAPTPARLSPGYYPNVRVLAPGRLDWTFVSSSATLDPAAKAMPGYDSTRQSYELYVPPRQPANQPYALIICVEHGWGSWQGVCKRHGIMFAGGHNTGNAVLEAQRHRIMLDVLDDVRRRFNIDPDRTYLTGMSGGGHVASSIAFALPELFGGHIPICGTWNLRVEKMLRQRVAERMSVAVLTGQYDFNGPEMVHEFFPILQNQGIRSHLWVYPGMAHAMPGDAQLEQVFQWVEAGLPERRLAAGMFPASKLAVAPSGEEWSNAVLMEAAQRLETPGLEMSGLFQLMTVATRWEGLPAAETAQMLLKVFDAVSPVPAEEIYRMERLSFRYLQATMFDGTLNRPPPPNYPVPHSNLTRIGIALWDEIYVLAPPETFVSFQAQNRLAVLRRQLSLGL